MMYNGYGAEFESPEERARARQLKKHKVTCVKGRRNRKRKPKKTHRISK